MKYYFFLISSIFPFLDFAVLAEDSLEDYYKSMIVLNVYHEIFTSHLRTEYLQLSLGQRSIDYSTTTLFFEEDDTKIANLVMRKEDIRWNHLYLSATQEKNVQSKFCTMMAAYFAMFQSILMQERLYGRDALATAKNMELLSKVTEVLNEIMDYRTVRRQYPVPPSDPWAFPSNQEQSQKGRSAVDAVKEELAVDFYLLEPPEEEEVAAGVVKKFQGLGLTESRLETSRGEGVETSSRSQLEQPAEITESKEAEASSSQPPEETATKQKEPSEKEKELEWRKHSEKLPTIDVKYGIPENNYDDELYHKYVWKELLAIYGDGDKDAFVQVTKYFTFAITGRSYQDTVNQWTNTYEDYVPNMKESLAIWEKAEDLFALTRADYQSEESSKEKEWKSHPITILQSIEKIRYSNRMANAEIDETRTQKQWTLQYVNPKDAPADLKVV